MFLINSRYHLVFATCSCFVRTELRTKQAHLLPKLRCQFAEFLNQSSLKRLRILSSPTCVGLRYGHLEPSTRSFSWKHGVNHLRRIRRLGASSHLGVVISRFYPTRSPYMLKPGRPTPGWPILLRPSSLQRIRSGTGILTCFPSPTPLGLGLGTD